MDAPGVTDALVQDSTVFPISDGTWLVNTESSKWIGPRIETSAAAGPTAPYTYHTTFDLTGKPQTFVLTGQYSVDNTGPAVRLNNVKLAGVPQSGGFNAYTQFSVRSDDLPPGTVTAGVNTLAFDVVNLGQGYTGLRVDGLKVLFVPSGIAPTILTHPQGGGITSGATVMLTSRAYGSAPLSYQWFRGVTPIDGATAATYTIPSFTQALNGDYTVRVSNTTGNATSNIATLTALSVPPNITAEPQNASGGLGERVSFTVTAEGSAPLSYQWMLGATDIPNATNATLVVDPITAASAGNYSVRVTNPFGTDTSTPASLTIGLRGIYDTGVDNSRNALPDGSPDSHYRLMVNPDGVNDIPAVVHDSTVFPISTGNWLANTQTSKWISPVANTAASVGEDIDAGEGGGVYLYRLVVDATGFDPATISIAGGWATDNTRNRHPRQRTGHRRDSQHRSVPVAHGVHDRQHQRHLRRRHQHHRLPCPKRHHRRRARPACASEGLRGTGTLLTNQPALPAVTIAINASNQPVISFNGVAGTQYRVQRSTTLLTGSWSTIHTTTPAANGPISFTDTTPPAGIAFYRVAVGP